MKLRLFLHWMQADQRVDLDLSVGFFDEHWRHVGTCDYTSLRFADRAAVHSGDRTDAPAPDGASEFLDLCDRMGFVVMDETFDCWTVAKNPYDIRGMIGVQPQTPGFQDKTKLTELITMFAAAYGVKVDPKKFLDDVNLGEKADSYIESLSGGQKQRFSITAALVHDPKVFFLDEPTTGLDPQARRNLWKLIQDVRDRGISVILTTHYMDEAEVLCDRIAIMDQGKIIALDTPKNLIKALLKRGFTKEQHVEQANLEDVFIDMTGKGLHV